MTSQWEPWRPTTTAVNQYSYDAAVDTRKPIAHVFLHRPLTLPYDLDFKLPARYGHDPHACKKNPGQRLVGLKDVVETDGRTDTADRITFPANEIGNQYFPQ